MSSLDRAVAGATTWLDRGGLIMGDRLVTTVDNDRMSFARSLACMLAGIVEVPVPPDARPQERARLVTDSQATRSTSADDSVAHLRQPDVAFDDLPPTTPPSRWPRTRPLAYTSGTTGRRKGVSVGVHTHGWGHEVIADESRAFDHRHGDRHLVVSPLYHSGPLRHAAVVALHGGEVEVLPRFDVEHWQELLTTFRPTSMFCVPTHLRRLLAHPGTTRDTLASLDLLLHAGAPCPVPLKERLLELAPEGSVWEFYGSTEGQFTVCPPELWQDHPGSVGRARPEREVFLTDVREDGVGTVWGRVPPHAAWEYWDRPEATTAAWDGDAFTVGDLGRLDDGVLTLAGRPGDLVITGGVNVYPAELERALLDLPGVDEVVVFGREDADWGERVEAAVVADASQSGRALSPTSLHTWATANLPAAQRPKRWHLVADLPRTPTGKIARTELDDLGA